MCLDPVFMTQGEPREGCPIMEGEVIVARRHYPEVKIRRPEMPNWRGICEYADRGCEKARDKKTFENYCEWNGRGCPDKMTRIMEARD